MIPGEQEINVRPAVKDHTPLLIRLCLLSLSSFVVLYSLGSHVLRTWDESIYAEVAKEMLRQHHWLTPHWSQQPWFEKPPLLMWATALVYRLFGISELSSRLITALCGIAAVWLTFELGKRLEDAWTGLLAAAVLLSNGYFIYMSRFGTLDVPLAACFMLAAYGYVRGISEDKRWWYAVGTAVGAACMLKGAGGVVAPLALLLALLSDCRLSEIRSHEVRNSALLALAIVLPWHLTMLILHGHAFLQEYFGYHVLARIKGVEGHPGPIYYYISEYWHEFVPLSLMALLGVFLHLKAKKNWSIAVSFPLLLTLAYSFLGTKLPGYAIPAFPFLSLLAALAMRELAKSSKYAVVCAVLVLPLYWSFQWNDFKLIFAHGNELRRYVVQGVPLEPLAQLATQARPRENDRNPSPLIVCLDAVGVEKQQPLFYSSRPVIQAFVAVPPQTSGIRKRYFDPVPLDVVVDSRSTPVIAWIGLYTELAYSGRYNFTAVARSGPLILGYISRPQRGVGEGP